MSTAVAEQPNTISTWTQAPAEAGPGDDAAAIHAQTVDLRIFPELTDGELDTVRCRATEHHLADGEAAYTAGDADVDFLVVVTGGLAVLNPIDANRLIVVHGPRQFVGDIDLLTRRPVNVTVVARGPTTVLRMPGDELRRLLNTVPGLSQKLIDAFQARRDRLIAGGLAGARVFGPAGCMATTSVREFLYKNFVPATWVDTTVPEGAAALAALNAGTKTPVVQCPSHEPLRQPSLRTLAKCVGIVQECPIGPFDLAVVGAGPAGLSAAVYAASEGLSTIVLDGCGPGGQAAGSSRIENFIGFPSGLSGTDLATRATLQLLKFGSQLAVPFRVQKLVAAPADSDDLHELQLDCGHSLMARTVLAATGVKWRKLDVPGAAKFERGGVHYACTTVEAEENRGHDVCVVGGGNSAGQAAMYLSEQCGKTVHVLVRGPGLAASMSSYLEHRLRTTKNVQLHFETVVAEVHGDRRLSGVTIKPRNGGDGQRLDCSAVFVFIGADPTTDWLGDAVGRDGKGYVLTGTDVERSKRWPLAGRGPCPLETTVPRLLAAGDIRAGSTKRVGFAVGDGSLACTCVHSLLTVRA